MKRILYIFITAALIMASFSFCFYASANFNSEKDVTDNLFSEAYYMISLDDETELFSKNEEKKLAPAGFTKLVAAVVAIEKWNDLDDKIKITEDSLSIFPTGYGLKSAWLKEGETYTKRQLVDCLIIYSPNDVASVIVQNIAGSKDEYLKQMTELLSNIGCKNTNIVDILGFDAEGQYTTAKDIATFLRYALKYPVFSEAFSQSSITMPATAFNNERIFHGGNKMMSSSIPDYYHSSINGGKYTSTTEAGECMAVTTSKDGYSYLVVVMNGKIKNIDEDSAKENTAMTDARTMISWVYKNIFFKVVATPGQVVYSTDIQAAKGTDTINLTPEKEVSVLAPSKVSSYSVLIEPIEETLPKRIKAPVKKGEIICQAKVFYANKELTTINLVAIDDIGLSLPGLIISAISLVLMSRLFIACEIIALIVLLAFLVIRLINSIKQKKPKLQIVNSTTNKTSAKNTARIQDSHLRNRNIQNRQKNNTKQ